ncbi:MAG: hypothetical protein C5B53_13490 [Candidatus Melainabacteria bacterium]|nr:MAG: hypothetical protein C5B53_13490 [Candidatus Melainabacteria bacterium]
MTDWDLPKALVFKGLNALFSTAKPTPLYLPKNCPYISQALDVKDVGPSGRRGDAMRRPVQKKFAGPG